MKTLQCDVWSAYSGSQMVRATWFSRLCRQGIQSLPRQRRTMSGTAPLSRARFAPGRGPYRYMPLRGSEAQGVQETWDARFARSGRQRRAAQSRRIGASRCQNYAAARSGASEIRTGKAPAWKKASPYCLKCHDAGLAEGEWIKRQQPRGVGASCTGCSGPSSTGSSLHPIVTRAAASSGSSCTSSTYGVTTPCSRP